MGSVSFVADAAADPRPDPRAPLARHFEAGIHAAVLRACAARPEAVALVDPSGSWRYGELAAEIARVARALAQGGFGTGQLAVVFAHRSAALVPALVGILQAGGGFAILDPSYPPRRLAGYVDAIRPTACVALAAAGPLPIELEAALARVGGALRVRVGPRPEALRTTPPEPRTVAAEDLAYVSFTSGTTGKPKAILGLHHPLPHFIGWHAATWAFTAEDRFAMLSGLAHDPLLRDVFTPLSLGASLHVPAPDALRDPVALRTFLDDARITAIHLTPSLGQLLGHGEPWRSGSPLQHLRHAFFAGERLARGAAERFQALAPHAKLVNFYGATETPQAMGFHVVDARHRERPEVPVGRGIEGVQLLVLDADRKLCEPGALGEICVRTPYLTAGYLGDAALTGDRYLANPFTGDPSDRLYRTGDLGRYLPDGEVELVGRADGQVKIRGFRVELEEVEAALQRQEGVAQAVVVAQSGETSDPRLVAYVRTEPAVPREVLLAKLRAELPDYMLPRDLEVLERFPLTPNGKVDRAALPPPSRRAERRAPATPTEARLAALWERVLGVQPIGVDEPFAELGGESLLGLELLTAIERELGPRLPVSALLTAPTVAEMARLVDGGAQLAAGPLVPLQPHGHRAPLYWLPGGGGVSALAFREVSLRLGADQPAFGLEAEPDLDRAPRDLPELATRYLEALRRRQPRGPYHLLGFSLGSFVAYEMAVQLRSAGQEVGLLGLFDTAPRTGQPRGDQVRVWVQRSRYQLAQLQRLRGAALRGRLRRSQANLRAVLAELASRQLDALRLRLEPDAWRARDPFAELVRRNVALTYAYASQPLPFFDGTATVFVAEEALPGVSEDVDPRLGWRRFAKAIEVERIPGNHLTVLKPPHVDAFAARLRACLERVAPGPLHLPAR